MPILGEICVIKCDSEERNFDSKTFSFLRLEVERQMLNENFRDEHHRTGDWASLFNLYRKHFRHFHLVFKARPFAFLFIVSQARSSLHNFAMISVTLDPTTIMATRTNEQLVYNQRGFGFDPEIPTRKRHQIFYMAAGSISSKAYASSSTLSVDKIAPLKLLPGEDVQNTSNLIPVLYVGIRLRDVKTHILTHKRAMTRGRNIEAEPSRILPQQPAYRVVVPVKKGSTNKQVRYYAVTTMDNSRANGTILSSLEYTWFFAEYRDDTQTDIKTRGRKSTLLVKEQILKTLHALSNNRTLSIPSLSAPSTTTNTELRNLFNPHTPQPQLNNVDSAFTELQSLYPDLPWPPRFKAELTTLASLIRNSQPPLTIHPTHYRPFLVLWARLKFVKKGEREPSQNDAAKQAEFFLECVRGQFPLGEGEGDG